MAASIAHIPLIPITAALHTTVITDMDFLLVTDLAAPRDMELLLAVQVGTANQK